MTALRPPAPSTQPTVTPLSAATPFSASALASPFSASSPSFSSPSFSSLSSSSSASQSAPSSFSSTFPSDAATTFTHSSPAFTPFSFPAVADTAANISAAAATTASTRQSSRPFRPTSTSSPKPSLLHAGTKRGSLSRDNEDDDDYNAIDDDDLPARPLKRLHEERYGSGEGDDDEYEQADFEDEEFKGADVDDVDAGEDTFANLLTHFANLHVPTSSTKPEQCPICNNMFPLSEFADHVYSCLTVLDDVEKKEQERLDEKMAPTADGT